MDVMQKKSSRKWDALRPVLVDHVAWFHQIIGFVFYPEHHSAERAVPRPTSFAEWFLNASRDPLYQPEVIDRLNAMHRDLIALADALVAQVTTTGQKPSQAAFHDFMTHYEEFIDQIRRLEQDFLFEFAGFDPVTGLRNPKLLLSDVKREQDRLERQGKPFILGLARIDHFEDVSADYPEAETEAYVKLVSDLIKLSIRSFDEAYYVGEGKFVLVLKQASIKGGVFALERLRRELEDKNIIFRLKDGQAAMTMSCCLAEPAHSDKIDVLLENIEADLNTYPGKMSDTVLEYYEMSPLQRYMRESSGAR